jgi:hypothetical protein
LRRQIAVCLVAFFAATPLFARSSTDVVVMKNGDRLTCEIKKLDHGVLSISLDYVDGTVYVDWLKVERIESNQLFEVETADGSTYSGTLKSVTAAGDEPRRIEIREDQPTDQAVVTQTTVVRADQLGNSFWQNLHGSLSGNFMYSKSNGTAQYNFSSELYYRRERMLLSSAYTSAFSRADGAVTSTRNQFDVKGQHLMRWSSWYYEGTGSFLQSSAQGIIFQSLYGAGIGRYLKNTNRVRFDVAGGLALQDTAYTEREAQKDLVSFLAAELRAFHFKKDDLTITPVLIPSITDRGRTRFNLNATYKIQIISNLWWNVTLYGNWDSRPPVGLKGSDTSASTGITYSFH